MTVRDALNGAKLLLFLVGAVAIGIATYVGYTWFTSSYDVSTDDDGKARGSAVPCGRPA